MKTLVYYCIGFDNKYNKMLKLSLFSLKKYYDGDILILTGKNNHNKLKNEAIFKDIKFMEIESKTKFESAINRFNIYKYEKFSDYDAILYLDCDTLIINKLNGIFKKTLKYNKIVLSPEYDIDGIPKLMNSDDFFGKYLYNSEELSQLKNIGLNSGVFCLPTTKETKLIFNYIYKHAMKNSDDPNYSFNTKNWGDQPYLNYYLLKYNYYVLMDDCYIVDNKLIKMTSNINLKKDYDANFKKYIYEYKILHFVGPIWGDFNLKYNIFLNMFPKKIINNENISGIQL